MAVPVLLLMGGVFGCIGGTLWVREWRELPSASSGGRTSHKIGDLGHAHAGHKQEPWNVDQRHEGLANAYAGPGHFDSEADRRGEESMATDYDAPRRSEADELAEDSLEELKARRNENQSGVVDVDEDATAENFELPGADLSGLSGEDLTVKVVPKQADEFTCSMCFLVHHRSRLAEENGGRLICRDCA